MDLNNFLQILKQARNIGDSDDKDALRVAFVGKNSLQLILSVTRFILFENGIVATTFEGSYDGLIKDIIDEESALYDFSPDFLVMIPDYRDIESKLIPFMEADEINNICNSEYTSFLRLFEMVNNRLPMCQIICGNIVVPYFDSMEDLSANYIFSNKYLYESINRMLLKDHPSYVTLVDLEGLSSYLGKREWFDERAYYLDKFGFSMKFLGHFCDAFARAIKALSGVVNKCLVLDLDNTLWGGVIGEDGIEGIALDPNDATGEAYIDFQKYVLGLKERGVILAVCSKNDEHTAREPFNHHKYMQLKLDDISIFVANWDDKVTNIKRISKELNIGLNSLVFFDDNPTERELVREYLPEVSVVDVPGDPSLFVRTIDESRLFYQTSLSKEDIGRTKSYIANASRAKLMLSIDDYEEYLKALCMRAQIKALQESDRQRFVQLINKSNQFNLRTKRYTDAQIEAMMDSSDYELFCITLEDKFSDYGIISCVILKHEDKDLFIDTWVMSCRVLKKDVEKLTFNKILEIAKNKGDLYVTGEYIKTQKNTLVSNLLDGFGLKREKANGDSVFYRASFSELKTSDCSIETI